MITGALIIGVLLAALLYSGRVSQPAWAQQADRMTLREFAADRVALRNTANRIQARKCRSPVHGFSKPARQVRFRVWNLNHWRHHVRVARALKSRCGQSHHTSLWLCVHAHEGAWNDPNDPYFGGLQMGRWFMATYAPRLYAAKGTANYWMPAEQMAVADRAYHGAGHSSAWLNGQWPGTRSECGA